MIKEAQAIEVEVVQIDGITPPERFESREESPRRQRQDWQEKWRGRMIKFDRRWWPVWLFLGTIAVALALTVGVAVGILFVILRVIWKMLRAVIG